MLITDGHTVSGLEFRVGLLVTRSSFIVTLLLPCVKSRAKESSI